MRAPVVVGEAGAQQVVDAGRVGGGHGVAGAQGPPRLDGVGRRRAQHVGVPVEKPPAVADELHGVAQDGVGVRTVGRSWLRRRRSSAALDMKYDGGEEEEEHVGEVRDRSEVNS